LDADRGSILRADRPPAAAVEWTAAHGARPKALAIDPNDA